MGFHVRGVDHLRVGGSSVPRKFTEQVFPDAAPRPASKTVIDRCRRTIFQWAIAPPTAASQHVHNPADNPPIVRTLNASYIRRQMRFNPPPLLAAQPKQASAHDPDPFLKANQDRIVGIQRLMSFDPSHVNLKFAA